MNSREGSRCIVGLDIGTTKICAIAAEKTDSGELKVIGVGHAPSDGLNKGVIIDIERAVNSIKKAVSECQLVSGIQITEVFAGIAGAHIQGINSDGMVTVQNNQAISNGDIERVIESAQSIKISNDREVIHILPQGYIVDNQDGVHNPLGMMGLRLKVNVHIVTCAATSAQNVFKCCSLAGLEVQALVLEPLASGLSVLSEDEKQLGVVLVDIGGGTSDVAVYSGGSIVHTAVLPVGGNHLTNDIATVLSTPKADAERLKHEHGVAKVSMIDEDEMIQLPSLGGRKNRTLEKKLLGDVLEPRVEEMFQQISAEIDRSNYRNVIASGVVLTGGCSLLPGIERVSTDILRLPSRIGYPKNVGGLDDDIKSPLYATGTGLLHYGASDEDLHSSNYHFANVGILAKVSRMVKGFMQYFY